MLIINADDWGGWKTATDAALACQEKGRITSVSAMVFMEDSARAAELAKARGMDVGLHVNFTQTFTDARCPSSLMKHQDRIGKFLRRKKAALVLYHPLLNKSFRAVFQAQYDEFLRLYGKSPTHIDGHQHMHLCTNMLLKRVIPKGERVRRSFSFWPGEKSLANRLYRRWVDGRLKQSYRLTDYFFALSQNLQGKSIERIVGLSKSGNVELMTHPEKAAEQAFLMSEDFLKMTQALPMGGYALV